MNTLSLRVAVRVAAAAAVTIGFTAGVSTLDSPVIEIPVLPAGLSGALLVVLGFILGRATRARTQRPTSPTPQVTARPVRPLPHSQPRVIAPTRVILPAAKDGGDVA